LQRRLPAVICSVRLVNGQMIPSGFLKNPGKGLLRLLPRERSNRSAHCSRSLQTNGLPLELAPSYLPEGYAQESLEASMQCGLNLVSASFSNGTEKQIIIQIMEYSEGADPFSVQFQKNAGAVGTYTCNGRTFYLFQNHDIWSGAWSDSLYMIFITGLSDKQQLLQMIDSIGQPVKQ
jgi:hypothetical protein